MDIKDLKTQVENYIKAMKEDGHNFQFVALIPTYPGISDTSYILQVKADWIQDCFTAFEYMTPKMFEVIKDVSVRKCLNRIDIYNEHNELHCRSEDLILINEIGYRPLLHEND
jgi:hypothetical protein